MALAAHVGRADLLVVDDLVHAARNRVGVVVKPEVAQHHGRRENHGRRVGDILSLDVLGDVSASWFKEGVFLTARMD